MVLKLLHEYTTTYRVVAGIRMLNTHYPDTDEQIRTILKPYQTIGIFPAPNLEGEDSTDQPHKLIYPS